MFWYALTLFTSALLLFAVQPMVGKMLLPLLGGTPAVWNTCMVFFQGTLLAGYAYAHLSVRWLGWWRPICLHLVLMCAAWAFLPIRLGQMSPPADLEYPVLWLLWNLVLAVGIPMFIVSSSAPLLQRWFSLTRHKYASDPYFLYAASNAGSMLALLSYPILLEPALTLGDQSRLWSTAYAVLIVMFVGCGLYLVMHRKGSTSSLEEGHMTTAPDDIGGRTKPGDVTMRQRLWWILMAFVPSSHMLGVTTYITTDVAAVPLLWILPLSLYLLTFILVFSRRQYISPWVLSRVFPFMAIVSCPLYFMATQVAWITVAVHLLIFFMVAMVCHGALARSRPPSTSLTEFYFWMSVGGVLGGGFNALIAPVIFDWVVEYPLAVVLACFVWPKLSEPDRRIRLARVDIVLPAVFLTYVVPMLSLLQKYEIRNTPVALSLLFGVLALVAFGFKGRPIAFGLCIAVIFSGLGIFFVGTDGKVERIERNFYGIKRVVNRVDEGVRELIHGVTSHGKESLDPKYRGRPLSYYHAEGPLGEVFAAMSDGSIRQVAAIGLGVGSVAAYSTPDRHITFYEIDPAVLRLASDPSLFSFLETCGSQCDVIIGDGRLRMEDHARDGQYDMIILDAFSSDSIPTHLLTLEANELYLDKLSEGGILVYHISNQYLNLETLLTNWASQEGLVWRYRVDRHLSEADKQSGKNASQYFVIARSEDVLGRLSGDDRWEKTQPKPEIPIWTDQYSNIIQLIEW